MNSLLFPIIMLTVTVTGGGIFLLYLKAGSRRKADQPETAAMLTAQQFMNVKDIRDQFLYTREGQIFSYLRIHAISIDLFSENEKETMIKMLTAELSDIQYRFKFIALSRPVDISPLIADMTDRLIEADEKQKELLRQEILQMSSYALSGEIVERQFYIALWEKQEEGCVRDLKKRASLLTEKFGVCGISCDMLAEKEIIRLLNLMNNPAYTHLEDTDCSSSIPFLVKSK